MYLFSFHLYLSVALRSLINIGPGLNQTEKKLQVSCIMLMVLTVMSGWMQPPARRCLFSVPRPDLAGRGVWCNFYPGKGREGTKPYTSSYVRLISLRRIQAEMRTGVVGVKGVWWHLVQSHAEGADEAPILVPQRNGGGWPTRKKGMRSHSAHKWNVRSVNVFLNPHILTVHLHFRLGVVDEILQWVSTWIVVLELCVVGDRPGGGVEGPDHPADVDLLDVREVGEYACPWRARGLRNYLMEGMII